MKYRYLVFPALISIIAIILYISSLNNDFVMDDRFFITKNNFIKNWHNIVKLFSPDYFDS
jgi:hypothetical protein